MAGNIFFLSEIYRPIFQARNFFFLHNAWKDFFFPNFFLGINFFFGFAPPPPPPPHHFSNGPSLIGIREYIIPQIRSIQSESYVCGAT